MSSLMTNSTAMTALQTLRNIGQNLATTQNRISTGYRVATAQDNSAYWSIATAMRSDNAALSAVSDALGLGAATVDTMYTALTSTLGDANSGLTKLHALLVEAKQPGLDRGKIQDEISAILADTQNKSDSATFNGENWLSVDSSQAGFASTQKVVSSFARTNGTVSINTIDVKVSTIDLYDKNGNAAPGGSQLGIMDKLRTYGGTTIDIAQIDIRSLTDSPTDQSTLSNYIQMVNTAMGEITTASAGLGAVKSRIQSNSNFVKSLMDSIDRGIGQLVDADMNAESTRLSALQVQQQLGVQALSIANANSQVILSLFR